MKRYDPEIFNNLGVALYLRGDPGWRSPPYPLRP